MIRLATPTDAGAIQAIYAPIVRETVISFELEFPTEHEMKDRITETLTQLPWLVWVHDETILGYAYAAKHRTCAAYQWSVDTTVYVHVEA